MSSRSQVTITLGRNRQVVKRSRPVSDVGHSDFDIPSSGVKLDLRERLGTNMNQNKRQRTENNSSNFGDNTLKNVKIKSNHPVGHNDLRLKLLNKSLSRRRHGAEGQNKVDLREKLSQSRQVSFRSDAQHSRESDARQSTRELDARYHIRESGAFGPVPRVPSRRSADDLLQLDSMRKPYSSMLEVQRHRSPDVLISASRAMPPSRSFEDLQHASSMRSIDSSRHSSVIANGIIDPSRSSHYTSKTIVPDTTKPVIRAPTSASIIERRLHMPEQPLTVSSLLHSLGLEKYAVLFQAEEVDMTSLKQMGDSDLKELGIPMGPRKKIMFALSTRVKLRRQ